MVDRFKGATRDTFRSLGTRNFRLFFGGQLISQVGNWLTLIAQALLVLHLTGNGVAVGALTACQFAPVLVIGPSTACRTWRCSPVCGSWILGRCAGLRPRVGARARCARAGATSAPCPSSGSRS